MIETIKNDRLEVSVKSLGAELTSIKTIEDGKEHLWQGDRNFWSGQSPILFPIVGGLPDGKLELDGKSYEMASHGFARTSEFKLAEKTENALSLKLDYSEETLKQYPYKFKFFVTYRIEGNVLKHGFIVNNLDEKDMLFSVGAHPGFNCPFDSGEKMEDYRLVFEKEEWLQRRIKDGGVLTGEKIEFMGGEREKILRHDLFYNDAVILDSVKSEWLEIRSSKNDKFIRVEFPGFPYLGIWSARKDAPYVCIEPWYGVDSSAGDPYDFTKKEGLERLAPGKRFQCEYSIIIDHA